MRNLFRFLAAGSLFCLAGCLELVQVVTLNPDGSGRSQVQIVGQGMPDLTDMMGEDDDAKGKDKAPKKADPNKKKKDFIKNQMQNSQGVDAWADMTCEELPDGRLQLKALVYFSDVSGYSVGMQSGGGPSWTKDEAGGMVLMPMGDQQNKPRRGKGAKQELTDEQVAAKVKKAREQWAQTKPMMQMMLGTLKIDTTYILPGKIDQVTGMEKTDKGVRTLIEGKKVMEVFDGVMADDKLMAQSIREGRDIMRDGPPESELAKMMGGGAGTPKARVTDAAKAQFDYKAEMEKAKAAMPEMLKKLGLDPAEMDKPAIMIPGMGGGKGKGKGPTPPTDDE